MTADSQSARQALPIASTGSTEPRREDIPGPDRTGFVRGLTQRSFHRIAFTDWGPLHAERPVLCLHGLTRNGRDFDYLAVRLAEQGRRVICPDLPGRGRSERLPNDRDYVLPQYCRDMNVMMASSGASEVDWVGSSLGGLTGMVLAAMRGSPIRKLVINDIGPYLPWAGLMRLSANLDGAPRSFETADAAEAYYRKALAPFGQLDDVHWRHLTRHSIKWNAEQRCFATLCDPNIAHAFRNPWQYSVDLWKYWDAIKIPILIIRGRQSDLLPESILKDMIRRNGNARVHTVEDCGHAPALIDPAQIAVVTAFLNGPDPGA